MADMIKFYKGLETNLPVSGENGALYVTTDEGAIYLGTGTGMKRLGDFVQVANITALPEKAHESCLYYCVAENILAKWNGTEWKQINKQPTAEELKTLLGLGSAAYASADDFDAAGAADAVREYVGDIPSDEDGQPLAVDVIAYINKKTDGIATSGNLEALGGRVSTAESDIDGLQADVLAINNEETGILAQTKAYVDEEDKFDIDMNTISSLGGIAANSDLNGMTTHDILKKLLYPYVDASVGNATASPNNGGTFEKGVTKTITGVSITVTKKSEPITSVALYNGSTEIETKTNVANGGTITFTGLNIPVSSNGGKLTVKVTYPTASGAAKTVTKETGGFTFIAPYFYGVCGAADEINADLVLGLTKDLTAKGTKTYSYNTNSQRMVIAYPTSYGKIKLVKDGNGLDNTGAFGNPTTVSVTSALGSTEDYYVYANGVTSGSAKMTFSY